VFGLNNGILNEDVKAKPLNYYGLSHSLAEEAVFMYNRRGDMNCSVLRLPNILGLPLDWEAFDRWSLAPFDFCLQAAKSNSIVLRTAGDQKRNWLEINAMAKLAVKIVNLERSLECVHLVGTDMSIVDFAKAISADWKKQFSKSVSVDILKTPSLPAPEPLRKFSSKHNFKSSSLGISDFVAGVGEYLKTRTLSNDTG